MQAPAARVADCQMHAAHGHGLQLPRDPQAGKTANKSRFYPQAGCSWIKRRLVSDSAQRAFCKTAGTELAHVWNRQQDAFLSNGIANKSQFYPRIGPTWIKTRLVGDYADRPASVWRFCRPPDPTLGLISFLPCRGLRRCRTVSPERLLSCVPLPICPCLAPPSLRPPSAPAPRSLLPTTAPAPCSLLPTAAPAPCSRLPTAARRRSAMPAPPALRHAGPAHAYRLRPTAHPREMWTRGADVPARDFSPLTLEIRPPHV